MERRHLIVGLLLGAMFIALIIVAAVLVLNGGHWTSGWEPDERGVWVARGKPRETPTNVQEQQFLIHEAQLAYMVYSSSGADLASGPCLGPIFSDWVADIVHRPRIMVDDDPQNQCAAFLSGEAHHVIELSPAGEIVRIF